MTLLRCCSQETRVLALCLWKSPFLICIQLNNHSPPSLLWHPSQGCQLWVREIYSSSQHHHQQQGVIGRERSKEEKHPEPSWQRTRSAPRPNRLHPMSLRLLDIHQLQVQSDRPRSRQGNTSGNRVKGWTPTGTPAIQCLSHTCRRTFWFSLAWKTDFHVTKASLRLAWFGSSNPSAFTSWMLGL